MTWKKTVNTEVIESWYNNDLGHLLILTNDYKLSGFKKVLSDKKYRVTIERNNRLPLNESFTTKEDAEKFCSIYRKNHP